MMTPDTAQGVSAELNFTLKEGWSFSQVQIGSASGLRLVVRQGQISKSFSAAKSGGSRNLSPTVIS